MQGIGAGPVIPVSTRPLFPSLMVCLASPISTLVYRMPTQGRHAHSVWLAGDIPHVETCKMAANSEKEFLPSFSSLWVFLPVLHVNK